MIGATATVAAAVENFYRSNRAYINRGHSTRQRFSYQKEETIMEKNIRKIVIIPDSFKGTLSSKQICEIISGKVKEHLPECEIVSIPVADGGEGSVDCFVTALNGDVKNVVCKNPYFEDINTFYGVINNGNTAVIETASCAGLCLVEGRKNPMLTTTYGVGQQIADAAKSGCKKIIVGLGGSCTNDCGCGAAAAVGVRFYDKDGNEFIPTGGTLKNVERIDTCEKIKLLDNVEIITMCDIDSPMYGKTGAAYVFAPQKGADMEMVKELDDGLVHISKIISRDLRINVADIKGGGAAGAMGAGMAAFFNSGLQMGIETVLDTVSFDDVIRDADVIFTGEGKIDSQSLRGKVVIGVAKRAKLQNVPVVVIAGGAEPDIEDAYALGVTSIFTINRMPEDFSVSRYKSEQNLCLTVDNILRLMKNI